MDTLRGYPLSSSRKQMIRRNKQKRIYKQEHGKEVLKIKIKVFRCFKIKQVVPQNFLSYVKI